MSDLTANGMLLPNPIRNQTGGNQLFEYKSGYFDKTDRRKRKYESSNRSQTVSIGRGSYFRLPVFYRSL